MDATFKPQFTVDDLYITPFKGRRVFDPETGERRYEPIERNLHPSGVHVLDAYVRYIGEDGQFSRRAFVKRHGISSNDLSAMCRVLTGLSADELFHEIRLRLADDLLRYTSLPMSEVARRCGANTQQNLCVIFRNKYKCIPTDRRWQLRRKGDNGKFCV